MQISVLIYLNSYCRLFELLNELLFFQDLMLRQWNIRTLASLFGMLVVRTRYLFPFFCFFLSFFKLSYAYWMLLEDHIFDIPTSFCFHDSWILAVVKNWIWQVLIEVILKSYENRSIIWRNFKFEFCTCCTL